jgi:hypothetical protein
MSLPASFHTDGFVTPKPKLRRLMIGAEGSPDTGKTEFASSAPGPGIVLCLDRGYEGMLDNRTPPPTRNPDFVYVPIHVPLATSAAQPVFLEYWKSFYSQYSKALANKDARTLVLDGDSDSWELQRLAEFGKLVQVPPILYQSVNAARRAMIAKAYDSGKIIIATNKLKKVYRTKFLPTGLPATDNSGKEIREWDGKSWERQGFEDQDYLWQVQIKHLYDEKKKWGIRILKCKVDKELNGMELWGGECNFQTLVQVIYPNVPLSDWGY